MKVYEKIYNYFLEQMATGALKPGDRMPSIRECERILTVSRTSVETAYLQLAADGYIYSLEKVGYFCSDMAARVSEVSSHADTASPRVREMKNSIEYDLATLGEDKEVSCLNLWRRYMKSALRQEDRLLSYATGQGEEDLRTEIAAYVRKTRNIYCSAEDIVIGAGFQNLLQILIALIPGERTISFPTKEFSDGATTFKYAGFEVDYRNKECHVIYVTPSYMTKWGEVMTMKRRHELVDHALLNDHLIIEDDYQNEFVFSSKPTPSLYAMTGGKNTAFLGSFSRVVLPSVRISYIILPKGIRKQYEQIAEVFNQTASKAEQIALGQFLRDGHLNRHIKRMRHLYELKRDMMLKALEKYFDKDAQILSGTSGMEFGLRLKGQHLRNKIEKSKVAVNFLQEEENGVTVLLSCSKIPLEDIEISIKKLNDSLQK